jgi:DNA-binding CsgD family transcriptional regulator
MISASHALRSNLPERRLHGEELLRDLERRFRNSRDALERAHLADRLVPELVSVAQPERAAQVLANIGELVPDPDARARLSALRGVVRAMAGESPADDLAAALALLPAIPGPTQAVVRQRAGVASAYSRDALGCEEHSLAALTLCDRYGMRGLGSRAAGVLYGLYYHLTGDLQAARYYAELATSLADSSGDTTTRRSFLVAQYDLACVFADWDRAGSLRELIRRDRLPEPVPARLPTRIGDALMFGQRGDFNAMRAHLEATLSAEVQPIDRAFVMALHALALAGLGCKSEANPVARQALALSNMHQNRDEMLHLAIRRKLAGVLAAWASVVVGDAYHGMRALGVRSKWPGSTGTLAAALESEARGSAFDTQNPSIAQVRGYLIVAQRARLGNLALEAAVPFSLTQTEVDVLRAVAQGKSNAAIALERGVTRNAVERRLMSAYEKLDVKTRGEAIAKISRLLRPE